MDLRLVSLLVVCCLGLAKATYYSAGGVVPAGPGFGGGNYGDVMSPTYFGSVYGRSGDAYGGSARAYATHGSSATAFGGTAMTGPGVGPMTASGIGTGYTSGVANVGIGDRYGYYGMGNFGMGSMGKKGMGKYGGPGFSGGFAGGPGFSGGAAGFYGDGFGAPGLVGGSGYFGGGAAMGGRWIRRGFYYFPFPRYCPWPSTPVFKINKRWWYCRIGYFKKY